jgi:predicted phage baseplate assembly protein
MDKSLGSKEGFTQGNLVIRGNVVYSGHGETQSVKVLGSGDASLINQHFIFDKKKVSFIADSLFPTGVRGDVAIIIGDQTWIQVPRIVNSKSTDSVYQINMTEEGYLKISFGNGIYGRRLPTGNNNVMIQYRKGVGLTGNLKIGSLNKLVQPHPLIDKVFQPLKATGGNELEGIESLRENAPAALLTLERAVSLEDFTHLASSQSSVWQAKALSRSPGIGRKEKVEVVVIPAMGGALGGLKESLQSYLKAHALPGIEIVISGYKEQRINLNVILNIKYKEYDPEKIKKLVEAELVREFSLQKRKLGASLYLSEIYKVIEGISGVENSSCTLNSGLFPPSEVLRKIESNSDSHIIFIKKENLTITTKDYKI